MGVTHVVFPRCRKDSTTLKTTLSFRIFFFVVCHICLTVTVRMYFS